MWETKSGWVVKGIAFSAIYCAAYLVAWYHSLDQWFLPTGLRIAGAIRYHSAPCLAPSAPMPAMPLLLPHRPCPASS